MAVKTRLELREAIRTQMDMDDEELPDATLNLWLQDGYQRTVDTETRWPFFEAQWDITTVAEQLGYAKSDLAAAHASSYEVDYIASLLDITDTPIPLMALSHDRAEEVFGLGLTGSGGTPEHWSEWAGNINLWPAPSVGRTVRVRGYRKPKWDLGDAVEVDADSRLHIPIMYFAVAMAYSQQEDEILTAEWMNEWRTAVRRAHEGIMGDPQRRPLVMSGAVV